ncbi:MAG: 1-phosphofructokinase family hexose kinase [Desulfopila sp.]|jgi:6-phosphofructokinase 2|nr:1-phosphofructokinase family hexose kinase [Desulfopila sp.]
MANTHDIVTLTINPCLDISAEIDRLEPTKKMRCRNNRVDPGGGGINVSRAIKILDGTSLAVFPVGGSIGDTLVQLLDSQGIATRTVATKQSNRQSFAIRELEENRQYRFALPGPEIREKTWQDCFKRITALEPAPAYIVASGSLPPGVPEDYYGRLAEYFRDTPTRVVLDTSGEALKHALDARVYLIKPNQRELEYICDCSLANNERQEEMCQEIVNTGKCEVVVLSLGEKGALLTTQDQQFRVPALEADAISAVGAGDCFVGAMVLALQQKKSLKEAFLYGVAAGTAALATEATILCRKDQTEAFYDQLHQRYGDS